MKSNIHLKVLLLLTEHKYSAAIESYTSAKLLTEALVLAKTFGSKDDFKKVLKAGLNIFEGAKDRKAQAEKLAAAL